MKWSGVLSFRRVLFAVSTLALALGNTVQAVKAESLNDYVLLTKGTITLGGGSKATGLLGSGVKTGLAGASRVYGDVQSGADVVLNNGVQVTGTITNPGNLNHPKSSHIGGHVVATPSFPAFPSAVQFIAGNTDYQAGKNGAKLTLAPGSYGAVRFGSASELRLSAGDYYFASVRAANGFKLIIDLKGGKTRIYVAGKMALGTADVMLPSGGTPNDVYIEAQDHDDNAFSASGGSDWIGTVYAPYAGIHFGGGSCCSSLKGRFIALTHVDIEHGVTITPPPPPVCEEGQVVQPDGSCGTPQCPEGQIRNEAGQCTTPECPAGQVRNEAGQCIIPECPAGQIRNALGQCVIPECPVGTIRQADGSCTTTECPAGTVRLPDGQCGFPNCPDGSPRKSDGTCDNIPLCPNGQPAGPTGICSTPECTDGTTKDICGVCAGNGSSCNSCEVFNILSTQVLLDNTSHEQENLIVKATRALEKGSKGKEKSRARKIRAQAQSLYMEAWTLAYIMPSTIVRNCDQEAACASVGITTSKSNFGDKSQQLSDLLVKTTKYMKKYRKISPKTIKSYLSKNKQLHEENVRLLSTVPDSTLVCE